MFCWLLLLIVSLYSLEFKIIKCPGGYHDCERTFKSFFYRGGEHFFHIINQDVQMPGLLFFVKEGENQGEISFIYKKNEFHTEKYNLIIDLLSKFEDEKRQRFEISNSITSTNYDEDYFSRLRGTYFIYTYASACIYCANFYYHLTERFPNLIFKIFYTVPYTNEDKTLTKFFNSPFRVQRSLFYADCKRKTSNIQFVDDYDDLKDCFKEKYDKLTEGLIKFPRFSFQKLPTFGTTFTLVKKLMDM